jgi:hypothetical protein
MMRILKLLVLQVVMIMAPISAWADVESKAEKFDWDPVMDAIIQVESSGNPRAVSGIYAGVLQIAPVLVKDCNNILKSRGEKKRYTLSDRFNEKKSREMFVIIQSYYNPQNNVEKAIRLWNGGVGYKVASTQRYYNKVMSHMR